MRPGSVTAWNGYTWVYDKLRRILLPFKKGSATFQRMANKKPSPLQASFWLSEQEKRYLLVICGIFLLGLIARYWYQTNEEPVAYTPKGIEKLEQSHD